MADPMAALRARFLTRLADEQALLASDSPEAMQAIHRLAGSAGVFGFHALSERAEAVDRARAEGGPVPPEMRTALAAEVRRVLTHG